MKAIFKGCIGVKKNNLGHYGVRFSESQLRYLKSLGEHFEIRSLCGASVYLEFINESEMIEIKFNANNYSRENFAVDIYRNDKFLETRYFGKSIKSGILKIEDRELNNRYKLHFPNTCSWYIEELNGEIKEVETEKTKKVLLLGDSISQGMETIKPSITYINLLARMKKWDLLNQGVGGLEFDSTTIEKLDEFDPELILIALGTNDVLKNPKVEEKFAEIEKYLEKIKKVYEGKEVVIITPIPIINEEFKENYEKIQVKLKELGLKNNFRVIDGENLIIRSKDYYFDQEIHPNELGFTTMALNLINTI